MVTTTPSAGTRYVLMNARTGTALAERLGVVRATGRRLLGLLGRHWLDGGEGTRFLLGGSEHAARPFDRLSVDLVVLDREGTVLHAVHSLPPFEVVARGGGESHSIVELPAGTLARLGTQVGDVLEMYRRNGDR